VPNPGPPADLSIASLARKTHRYRLTPNGMLLTAALQATRRANIEDLLKAA